jgi:hypothetical protein
MCRILEYQQSFRKGQLPCLIDGSTPIDCVEIRNFLPSRRFLRIQPSVGLRGRAIKNYLPNQMGNLCL